MSKFISSAALGWFGRRILDWGGWLGTFLVGLLSFYNSLTPQMQDVIVNLLSSRWEQITLGAIVPFGALVFSQVMSFRATTKPQVVTTDGEKVAVKDKLVDAIAKDVAAARPRQPNLLERLFGRSR